MDKRLYSLTADDVARVTNYGPLAGAPRGLIPYSELHVEHVDWLIPGHVPEGMLTVLAGEQGLGKSLLHARWASELSRTGVPSILVSAEDSPTHTTKARLIAAEAEQTRVHHATILPVLGNGKDPEWLGRIRQWIMHVDARLLVFDPLSAFLDANTDSYKDQHVRRILAELDGIARETACAIVYVMHLTKGAGANPLQRIAGSIAFTAAARSVVLMTPETDPQSPERIVAHVKCNVAEKALPQRWEVEPILIPDLAGRDVRTARISFRGIADNIDVWTLLAPPTVLGAEERTERDDAKAIIRELLAFGDVPSKDLERAVREAGVAPRTYDRARQELGVRGYQQGRIWYSRLGVTSQDATAQDATGGWRPDKPAWPNEKPSELGSGRIYLEELRPEPDPVSQCPPNLGTASLEELGDYYGLDNP